jgi:serine/threonine protein phosphatase 1
MSVPSVERIDLSSHPGRIFAVGDLHGMAHAFDRLLALAGFDPKCDLVWSLGDLVDRGPFSSRCLALLDEPWFSAIRGNHEQLMLDAVVDRSAWLQWMVNGGDWALSYPWEDASERNRLLALPWAAELLTANGRVGLVHADVDRRYNWVRFVEALEEGIGLTRQTALWSRISVNHALGGAPGGRVRGVDLVLVGHSIVETCFKWGNMWFLDSGAVATNTPSAALSMLEIHPGLKLWSVSTAQDPIASQWWSSQMERISAAVAKF